MAGIYVHVPFCLQRCFYCDFFSTTAVTKRQMYVDALVAEINFRRKEIDQYISEEGIATIYFGGGTPSLLSVGMLEKIMAALELPKSDREFTIEVNPDDVSEDYFRSLVALEVNRISVGVQSFSDEKLFMLNRRHTAQEAVSAVQNAYKAGFDNISIDLMYGLPNQTLDDTEADIVMALQLPIRHLSAYCLTVETNTKLYKLYKTGKVRMADENTCNAMFDMICERLARAGFVHYEVSNYCIPGYNSRHNSGYWNRIPYIGLGAGSHSFDGNVRSWAVADLDQYIHQAKSGRFSFEKEYLTGEQVLMERVMLGLRTQRGVNEEYVGNKRKLAEFEARGLLVKEGGFVRATQEGLHILNFLIEHLV